jgi:uncharacterized membrane-anchored protein
MTVCCVDRKQTPKTLKTPLRAGERIKDATRVARLFCRYKREAMTMFRIRLYDQAVAIDDTALNA